MASDALTLLDPQALNRDKLLTGRQLTDIHLLALAVRNGGRLVTRWTATYRSMRFAALLQRIWSS